MPHDHPGLKTPILAGIFVIVLFFGVFCIWTITAPLDSAAIASGVVSVDNNRKTVQHLEGGIVEHIYVRDGDLVTEGQVLITLESTKAQASLDLLRGRLIATRALEARLIAERSGAATIVFPGWILADRENPVADEAITGQSHIFEARRNALDSQIEILKQKAAQSREEIIGLQGQIDAENNQLALLAEEKTDIGGLVKQGLAPKPRLLALRRREAEIKGSRSRNKASIARAEQTIAESELRAGEVRTAQINEVTEGIRDAQTRIYETLEKISTAEDTLKRTRILAPTEGIVVELQVHTAGGVITPGTPLMDILPSWDRRIVEARLDPADIDVVHPGQEARVRLTALPRRHLLPLKGEVVSISADRLIDAKTGQPYFKAMIVLNDAKDITVQLHPGMQAEVMIATGSRTLLEYLAQPLLQVFDRAMRET